MGHSGPDSISTANLLFAEDEAYSSQKMPSSQLTNMKSVV